MGVMAGLDKRITVIFKIPQWGIFYNYNLSTFVKQSF